MGADAEGRENLSSARRYGLGDVLVILVAVACFALVLSSLPGDWVYDDWPLIVNNSSVHGWYPSSWLQGDMWTIDGSELSRSSGFYRPLLLASYALDWWIGGGSPLQFHLTNGLIAVLGFVLSYRVFRGWLASRTQLAFALGLVWLHPSRVENYAWVSGRPDLLVAVGILLAVLGLRRTQTGNRIGWLLQALGIMVALLSKESGVVLPAFLLGELLLVKSGRVRDWKTSARALAPSAAVVVLFAGLRFAAIPPLKPLWLPAPSLGERAFFFLQTVGEQLRDMLLPFDSTFFRTNVEVTEGLQSNPLPVATGAALVLLALLVVFRSRSRRVVGLTLALLVILFPTANVVIHDSATFTQMRFLLLPLLIVAPLGALAMARWPQVIRLAVLATLFFSSLSWLRVQDFRDNASLWSAELDRNARSPEVLGFFVAQDSETLGPEWGMQRAICAMRTSRVSAFRGADVSIVSQLLPLLMHLTPAADDSELAAQYRFVEQVRAGGFARLRGQVELEIASGSATALRLRSTLPLLTVLQAELATRLGWDVRASKLAADAQDQCPNCSRVLARVARVHRDLGNAPAARAAYLAAGPGVRASLPPNFEASLSNLRPLGSEAQILRDASFGQLGRATRQIRTLLAGGMTPSPEVLNGMLFLASSAGDLALTERLARRLGVAAPEVYRFESSIASVDEPFLGDGCSRASDFIPAARP